MAPTASSQRATWRLRNTPASLARNFASSVDSRCAVYLSVSVALKAQTSLLSRSSEGRRSMRSGRHTSPQGANTRTFRSGFTMRRVPLCLGRLESTDFAPLPVERREAVDAFWAAYFAAGREHADIQVDGAGLLANANR